MERLICDSLLRNAEDQDLLTDQQFAYRKKRSTSDCLLGFMNTLAGHVNSRTPVDIVYTDFKSAFERMPHDLLVSVLPMKGVGPKITAWISDFLTGRSFRVKIDDVLSRTGYVSTGCPQGTVLGSLLFLFFVDQIKEILRDRVGFYIFADDVKLVKPLYSEADCASLQLVLDDLFFFTREMGLLLSPGKCGILRVGSTSPVCSYTIGDEILCRLEVARDLGVLFSPSLSFTEHVNNVVRKCSMISSWILRAFSLVDVSVYLDLYATYVVPHLEYCSVIWNPRLKKDRALLERMQNRFLRRVEFRCRLPRGSVQLLTISERFDQVDMTYLRRLIRDEPRFDQLFDLCASRSRSGFVLRAKALSRSATVSHIFPWRVSSKINGTVHIS